MLIFLQTTRLCQHTNKSLDVVITSLTNDLSHVDRWCQHNHMSINSDKSNVMFNSSRQNRQFLQSNPEIPYLDSVIKSCSTAKLLGVTVNNSLSWNDHIETVINKKCNTYLYILSWIKLYLSTDNCKRFYNAYILPHFVLCCVIWGKLHTLHGWKTSKTSEKGCPSNSWLWYLHPNIYNVFWS